MKHNIIATAQNVFHTEIKALARVAAALEDDFTAAVDAIFHSKGKVIISGMGKSGIIGKKIAATLASTGTPSFFIHPAEAYHGDLGMIERDDVVVLISYSGETDEVLRLIPFLKSQKNLIISMSGNPSSTLACNSDYHLDIHIEKEACPLQLAPTSSTTAALVMGDAVAVCLMTLRNFHDEHFARFHPGGSLGKKLLTKVSDVMRQDNLPFCSPDSNVKEIIHIMTSGRCGLAMVIENEDLKGIITDGDIRRFMEREEENFFRLQGRELMTRTPRTIHLNAKLNDANDLMSNFKISSLPVLDDNHKVCGLIQVYDTTL